MRKKNHQILKVISESFLMVFLCAILISIFSESISLAISYGPNNAQSDKELVKSSSEKEKEKEEETEREVDELFNHHHSIVSISSFLDDADLQNYGYIQPFYAMPEPQIPVTPPEQV